jgi:hypothetical protein
MKAADVVAKITPDILEKIDVIFEIKKDEGDE